MNFLDLSMDKQVKMVAEGYNGNGPIADLRKRLGVSQNVLYDRIDRARAIGLITKERVTGGASRAVVEQEAPEQKPDTSITPEFFKKQAEHRRVKAEGLNQQAKRLEQASAIATALEELLGNDAQDLVNGLYVRVS